MTPQEAEARARKVMDEYRTGPIVPHPAEGGDRIVGLIARAILKAVDETLAAEQEAEKKAARAAARFNAP